MYQLIHTFINVYIYYNNVCRQSPRETVLQTIYNSYLYINTTSWKIIKTINIFITINHVQQTYVIYSNLYISNRLRNVGLETGWDRDREIVCSQTGSYQSMWTHFTKNTLYFTKLCLSVKFMSAKNTGVLSWFPLISKLRGWLPRIFCRQNL